MRQEREARQSAQPRKFSLPSCYSRYLGALILDFYKHEALPSFSSVECVGSVPLASRKTSESDQADQGNDQAAPKAPDEHQHDANNDQDSAE
jgi:hypothetical protein